ncbi:DUF1684 domain-containing protein [Kineosporia sp. J2-2]|uniref:DUF1684 domain-containing protein n=1 Tax=Kineosporia corallincola TaxID=2835133 RepID=A0ABS5TFV0_9ACTN|nr:DUF1684 domain-containing protein [Kineosporia corallincola]MBT0769968.1 DUF1684 domain-containing protein [Kineosporia corallincola]
MTFIADWQEWTREREAKLADPHGFLAITGLHWLEEAPQRFDDAPGAWSTGPGGVSVELGEGETILVDDEKHSGRYSFGVLPERASVFATWGDAVIEVAKRGGHDIVRPRHPHHDILRAYDGTPRYEPDERWVVPATYRAFETPRPVTVGAAVEGLEHVYDAPGELTFEIDGQALTLTAFEGHAPGTLTVLFTDATSGVTTYAANRSLQVPAPGADGSVVLDFNRAANLPCAYTPLATCPLPPPENRLPVAIEAGEKKGKTLP